MAVVVTASDAHSEMVDVKYRGLVDLKPFNCEVINRSSFINRVCYDKAEHYMIIQLRDTNYHYCELPPSILAEFIAAPSMGRYYNQYIKGSGLDGPYDCRTHRFPAYSK